MGSRNGIEDNCKSAILGYCTQSDRAVLQDIAIERKIASVGVMTVTRYSFNAREGALVTGHYSGSNTKYCTTANFVPDLHPEQ